MSLLQDPDYVLYKVRNSYTKNVADGIGERMINVNHNVLKAPAYRMAGWTVPNEGTRRSYSPPIATNPGPKFPRSNTQQPSIKSDIEVSTSLEQNSSRLRKKESIPQLIRDLERDDDVSTDLSYDDSEEDEDVDNTAPQDDPLKPGEPSLRPTATSTAGNTMNSTVFSRTPVNVNFSKKFEAGGSMRDSVSAVESDLEHSIAFSDNLPPPPNMFVSTPFSFTKGRLLDTSDECSILSNESLPGLEPPRAPELQPSSRNRLRAFSNPKTLPPARAISKVAPISNLTEQIKAQEAEQHNPLESYIAFAGEGESSSLRVKIYRPTSATPSKPFEVVLKRDTSVADAIGYALYRYMEEKREPQLTEEQCRANHWTLRIVEDDGEPDEDFPALDRTRPLSKFSFDEFALVEATSLQVAENEQVTPRKRLTKMASGINLSEHGQMAVNQQASGSSSVSNSHVQLKQPSLKLGPDTGTSIFVRIRMIDITEPITGVTVNCSTNTYIGDILENICKKFGLEKAQYLLRLRNTRTTIPTDRTCESLDNRFELDLIKKRFQDESGTTLVRSLTPNGELGPKH